MTTAAWRMTVSMRGKQLPRTLLHCTRAMTRVRLSLTSHCLLHMYQIIWELLFGMVCTTGMAGTASHARAMIRRYNSAFTRGCTDTHRSSRGGGVPSVPHAETSGAGSVRRHSYAGAPLSLSTSCMVCLAERRSIGPPGGWQTSITPQPGTTSGTVPSGRSIPMHPRQLST